jgi:transcription antitermination factor NusA-like protein
MIKIGYLVPIIIIKALPDHDSYLTMIPNTEFMAILPKKYASMPWRIGDATVGCIHMMNQNHIVLSQISSMYYRKLMDMLLSPLEGVFVKRAAAVSNAGFVKIAVMSSDSAINPILLALPYLKHAKQYTSRTITLVSYSHDMKEYIRSALAPAPSDLVQEVIYSRSMHEANVYVPENYLGKFYGKGGSNVATAAKLTGVRITLKTRQITA